MIYHQYPPNIDKIIEYFPDAKVKEVVFAYAPHIYAPRTMYLSDEIFCHERVHVAQQGDDPEAWWVRYFTDKEFRLQQEYEAHMAEYAILMGRARNRHERRAATVHVAKKLASRLYGNMITLKRAKEALTKGNLYEPVREDTPAVP